MKLLRIRTKNFRTLDAVDVSFDGKYNAISGANNAGKSNLADALRIILDTEVFDEYPPVRLNFKSDFTSWKVPKEGVEKTGEKIEIFGEFLLDPNRDEGLVSFLKQFLKLEGEEVARLGIAIRLGVEDETELWTVEINGKEFSDQLAKEVRRRLKDGNLLVYHNSTHGSRLRYAGYSSIGQITEISSAVGRIFDDQWKIIQRKVKKATATQQDQLQGLVGRLSEKLKVSVEIPEFSGYSPFNLTLNENGTTVPLHKWGSGTQNKMMIFLAIIKASKASQSADSTERVTPIILLEEPESFLHPSAQSEFGNALIELSKELDVQVLSSTHSVSLINTDNPEANILLDRPEKYKKRFGTCQVDTSGDKWMNPFAALLGFNPESFVPWHDALRLRGEHILLVEGVTDQNYLERIQSADFGEKRLNDGIKVYSYHGVDNICNESILKLVIGLSARCVITCDLDAAEKAEKTFTLLGLQPERDYFVIGKGDKRGSIEDLVPDKFKNEVFSANPSVVDKLMGTVKEQRSAKNEMKKKICSHFIENANPGPDFNDFMGLAKRINRSFV